MFYRFTLIFIGSFWQLSFAEIDRTQLVPTNYCYSTDKSNAQRNHYSLETQHPSFSKHTNYKMEGCEPEKIWLVTRHGTRYPNADQFMKSEKMLPHVRDFIVKTDELCQPDYELLYNWKINETQKACGLVWPQGYTDLKELAQSFKNIYPTLFGTPYSPESYTFSHSSAVRTMDSCKAFTETLFGHKTMNDSKKYWSTNDTMLRPYSFCKQFQDYITAFNSSKNELYLFENSKHFEDVKKNISQRLGMSARNIMLGYDAITLMWNECKNEQDYRLDSLSPWCAAFTLYEAMVLEYVDDLDFYHLYSYGNPLSSVLPCTLIKSMLDATTSTSSNKVTVNFAHAELITLLITALGIKHDREPLLASNFEQQRNRQFRLSKLVPYASNFAAVTYNCSSLSRSSSSSTSSNQSSTENEESKVLMLLNQEPIEMPWCEGGAICTIDEMSRMFYSSGMRNCPYGICGDSFVHPVLEEDTC